MVRAGVARTTSAPAATTGPRGGSNRASDFFLGSVAQAVATAILGIVAARVLGPGGRGVVALLLSASVLGGAAGTLGLELALAREAANSTTVPSRLAGYLATATAFGLGIGALTSVVFLELASLPLSLSAIAVTAVASGLCATFTVMNGVLVGIAASRVAFVSRALGGVAMVVAGILLVRSPGDENGAVAALALGFGVTVAVQMGHLRGLSRRPVPRALATGLKMHAGTVVQTLTYRIDLVIVGAIAGAAPLGLYSVAVSLVAPLWFLPDAVAATVLRAAGASEGDSATIVARGCRAALLGCAAAATTVAAFGWIALPILFGDDFSPAYGSVLLLLPGVVALGLWKVHANFLFASGNDFVKLRGASVGLATTLVLDLILVPKIGIEGAAIGASVAYAATMLEGMYEMRRRAPEVGISQLVGVASAR